MVKFIRQYLIVRQRCVVTAFYFTDSYDIVTANKPAVWLNCRVLTFNFFSSLQHV